MNTKKYYVTFEIIQKVTYLVETRTKKEAIEEATFKTSEEHLHKACDISDHEYRFLNCFSDMDIKFYKREEKEKLI